MINDRLKVRGDLVIKVFGQDGELKDQRDIKNLIVTTGREYIASRMKDGGPLQISHMALGSGTTPAADGDTTLQNELSRISLATAGGTVSSNTVTYSATFGAGVSTGALTEAGLFNAAVAGNMLARTVFPVINKGVNDVISVSWVITILV